MKTQTFFKGALLASFISLASLVSAQQNVLSLPSSAVINSGLDISIDALTTTGNDKLTINGGNYSTQTNPIDKRALYAYTTLDGSTNAQRWRLHGIARTWLARGYNATTHNYLHGVEGQVKPDSIGRWGGDSPTVAAGGSFTCLVQDEFYLDTTPSDMNSEPFYLAGMRAKLDGEFHSNMADSLKNQNLLIASAMIAEDQFRDELNSNLTHAGYFLGRVTIADDVNRGFGTGTQSTGLHNDYMLAVNGKIVTQELVVTASNWADYVFEEDYALPTLADVETHISEFGHLPNVPSAAEVEENGISLKEMTITQQEKIEELFLYMIEMKKENAELKKEILELKAAQNSSRQ